MLSLTYAKDRSAIACLDVYVHLCMLRGSFAEHVCFCVFVFLLCYTSVLQPARRGIPCIFAVSIMACQAILTSMACQAILISSLDKLMSSDCPVCRSASGRSRGKERREERRVSSRHVSVCVFVAHNILSATTCLGVTWLFVVLMKMLALKHGMFKASPDRHHKHSSPVPHKYVCRACCF